MEEIFNISSDGASSIGDLMADLEENMLKMIKETSKAPADMWEHWQAFSAAINWNEPFIRNLLYFHAVVYLSFFILWVRKSFLGQSVMFLLLTVLVAMSESLNAACAKSWDQLTTQNYFDEHGIFAGLLFSGPLLLLCVLQLLAFLSQASSALIQAKKLEYKAMLRQRDNNKTSKAD